LSYLLDEKGTAQLFSIIILFPCPLAGK